MASTVTQMQDCLSTLLRVAATARLVQAKAMRQSEADQLSRQIRETRDFMLQHEVPLRALLAGEQLVPASSAIAAIQRAGEGGV